MAVRASSLTPDSCFWPSELDELPQPPARLWVRGQLSASPRIAVVGTRRADEAGLELAHTLSCELAQAGVCVVSGGARGIDAAAHRGALAAQKAATVAVLASGLERPYPPEHGGLFEEIVSFGGALLTEAEHHWAPHRGLFLQRNRLIAALSAAVVVVQAPLRSGALSTAHHAKELKRPIWAVPAFPGEPRGAGCLALLAQGARTCISAHSILQSLGLGATPGVEVGRAAEEPDDPPVDGVLSVLGSKPLHADEIGRQTGLPAPKVQQRLCSLLLEGRVCQAEAGGWRLTAQGQPALSPSSAVTVGKKKRAKISDA